MIKKRYQEEWEKEGSGMERRKVGGWDSGKSILITLSLIPQFYF